METPLKWYKATKLQTKEEILKLKEDLEKINFFEMVK